jgi:RNA polymerase sigma-70 factor (ECF subfamily)
VVGAAVSEQQNDLELVRRVQAGDKSAFDLLVLKYQHKIANLVSRFVHDSAEVQDVTQEAFIKAYRGLANFRGDSAFYTWLYRIAINTAKNYLTSRARRAAESSVNSEEAEHYESAKSLHDVADPYREAATVEIGEVIRTTIERLPYELQTAITLRELKGMSYEEIATVMECPVGTVRSRIFRAREAIDNELRPLLDETGKY